MKCHEMLWKLVYWSVFSPAFDQETFPSAPTGKCLCLFLCRFFGAKQEQGAGTCSPPTPAESLWCCCPLQLILSTFHTCFCNSTDPSVPSTQYGNVPSSTIWGSSIRTSEADVSRASTKLFCLVLHLCSCVHAQSSTSPGWSNQELGAMCSRLRLVVVDEDMRKADPEVWGWILGHIGTGKTLKKNMRVAEIPEESWTVLRLSRRPWLTSRVCVRVLPRAHSDLWFFLLQRGILQTLKHVACFDCLQVLTHLHTPSCWRLEAKTSWDIPGAPNLHAKYIETKKKTLTQGWYIMPGKKQDIYLVRRLERLLFLLA